MPTTDDLAALLVERAERCAPDRDNVLNMLDEYAILGRSRNDVRLTDVPRHVHRVHRSLAAAAGVIVAVGVGVGVGTLHSSKNGTAAAGGTPIIACKAPLPTAWQHALDASKIAQPGQYPQPLAVTKNGAVLLSWTDAAGDLHVGRLTSGLVVDRLAKITPPAATAVGTVAADGRHVVVSFRRRDRTSAIDLLDLATGRIRDLLPHAPLAAHAQTVGGAWLTIQHSTVYWPARSSQNTAPNILVSYNIGNDRYETRRVAGDAVYLNAAGIYWRDGHLLKQPPPPIHPPLEERYMTEAADEDVIAWSFFRDPTTVIWSQVSGAARTVRQHLARSINIDAVAGPYIFLDRGEGDDTDAINGDVYVLDIRTGALADTGTSGWLPSESAGGTVAFTTTDRHTATRVLNVTHLPRLHCG